VDCDLDFGTLTLEVAGSSEKFLTTYKSENFTVFTEKASERFKVTFEDRQTSGRKQLSAFPESPASTQNINFALRFFFRLGS
jgi:hypothetical protein